MAFGIGIRLFGAAGILIGVLGLIWGDFASIWQPVPEETPFRTAFAYLVAALFIGSGAALQRGSTIEAGAVVLILLNLVFAVLWGRRILGFPNLIGTWSGTAELVVFVAAGCLSYAAASDQSERRTILIGRVSQVAFGLCQIAFGLAHFLASKETASMVPGWLPPGQYFWAYVTGLCHFGAGLALLTNVLALLAARMLTVMFLGFSILVWFPALFLTPEAHIAWAGNAINLFLVGAAWTLADYLASRTRRGEAQGEEHQRTRGAGWFARHKTSFPA